MSYHDLHDWLKDVETHGELAHLTGANWDLEMSGISELVYESGKVKEPRPALLFDETPGYPKGYRTLFGMLDSVWRLAKTLGLPEDQTDRMALLRNWRNKAKDLRPIPPRFVSSGPVLENSLTGEDIDILKFPSPRFHEHDRKRYFGTAHSVIQKDPEGDWVNLGTYRNMVIDRNHLAVRSTEGHHGSIIMFEKYFSKGQVMPIAIAVGTDPILWHLSCEPSTPWGVSEYDVAGGIKGEPIEVIEGPYSGL
ncbi:UbiD family decarboxylase domain-containing protein, partial [Chloroflexota bacterium]